VITLLAEINYGAVIWASVLVGLALGIWALATAGARARRGGYWRYCPFCKSMLAPHSTVCAHCGRDLPPRTP